mmetsp:Transcript_8484/g.24315  ORF Transcript_8484/g.24315 Transcript_8484/m.24315 type:complete len:590 (+) Transcript_8484:1073-2842(+)
MHSGRPAAKGQHDALQQLLKRASRRLPSTQNSEFNFIAQFQSVAFPAKALQCNTSAALFVVSPECCSLGGDSGLGSRCLDRGGLGVGLLEQLVQDLTEGGMGMHVELDVIDRLSGGDGVGGLMDEVGSVQSKDVNSEDLARMLVVDHLGHSVALQLGQGLGVCLEGRLGNGNLEPFLLSLLAGLVLRHPHEGHLRVREACGGDRHVVDDVLAAAAVLYDANALGRRSVCKHVLSIGIADAVQAGHRFPAGVQHLHLVGDGNKSAAVGFDVDVLQAQALRVGGAARGDEAGIHLELVHLLLGVEVSELDDDGLHSGHARGDFGGEDVGVVVNIAGADKHTLRDLGNLPVKARHNLRHGLHKGHVAAEGGVHIGELQADVSRADDGHPIRQPLQLEGVVRGKDGLAIDRDAGGHKRDGACGDDDVLGGDGAADVHAAGQGVAHSVGLLHLADAGEDVHAKGGEGVAKVLGHVAGQLAGVVGHTLEVVVHGADLNAHGLEVHGLLHLPHAARGSQESLRGHTSTVHASATDVMALDDAALEAALHGMESGAVAANTAADDQEIIVVPVSSLTGASNSRAAGARGPHRGSEAA